MKIKFFSSWQGNKQAYAGKHDIKRVKKSFAEIMMTFKNERNSMKGFSSFKTTEVLGKKIHLKLQWDLRRKKSL